ncbi:cell death regulator Aven-like isoform X2 [Physella acuta]|uniref:cell death regulator Aven-like isoform X2 n=1 Tax=Physella acuta TaxID=109671 RepID=UPI0027DE5ACE|nr:cell death regulator Aven-like isoform X2 [Physella acuta]
MRPDEHKKKKNEAYKKKHGITKSGGDDQSSSNEKQKNKKFGKDQRSENNTKPKATTLSSTVPPHEKNVSSSDPQKVKAKFNELTSDYSKSGSSDDEMHKAASRKTYRKREIVSNWQRYELEPDNEDAEITARGESFEKLISLAGNHVSHFRFKDELEWEESDTPGTQCTGESEDYSHILDINTVQLAQQLSCIPVHTVLGISTNVFPLSQVESMRQTAEKNRSVFCLSHTQRNTDTMACDNLTAGSSDNLTAGSIKSPVVSSSLPPGVSLTEHDVSERDLHSVEHRLGTARLQENFNQVQENKPVAASLQDNSFSDSTQSVEKKISHSSQPKKEEISSLEDWLDSVLDD